MDYKQYPFYQLYVYKNDKSKALTSFLSPLGFNIIVPGVQFLMSEQLQFLYF
jgi:hypothetical protein